MRDLLSRLESALGDRYRIERELGHGGMATVYLAEDLKHDRQVAVKVLRPELGAVLGAERFLAEIKITARLDHPHILTLIDSGAADGFLYYVLPFVRGESLRDKLTRERQLGLEEALQITKQVASALDYAHRQGVVHRDIKPENILLQEGEAMLADFGIALAVREAGGNRLTESGLSLGTPQYMSPEQATGDRQLDARSDVYSLGAVLYEMLAGEPPVTGPNAQAMIAKLMTERPTRLRVVRDTVTEEIDSAVAKALAKTPADRYPSAAEFARALASPGTAGVGAGTSRRRSRWLRFAGGAAVLAVVAVGLWDRAFRTPPGATGSVKLAVLPFDNLTGEPGQEYFSDGLTQELITQLGRLNPQHLGVIARASIMRYKKTDKPIDLIGRELGVQYILEGSAQHEGGRVRIAIHLIRVRDQTQLWADSYDRELSGILPVQSAVAQGVARSLALTLLPAEQARLASAQAVNPAAYEAYLKGRFYSNRFTQVGGLDAAMQYFQSALREDPEYALAYAGVGEVWWLRGNMLLTPFEEGHAQAKAAALKALELDDRLAEGHDILGRVLFWYEWDWPAAEREYRRAIELNPNSPDARTYYSTLLMSQGRGQEALAQIEEAIELDPLNSGFRTAYAYELGQLGRYDDAIMHARNALGMAEPDVMFLHEVVWRAFHQKRMYPQALEEAKALFATDPLIVEALSRGYAEGGYAEANRRAAEKIGARSQLGFWEREHVAILYAFAGQKSRALDWLEKGFETRHSMMSFIGVDPHWDALRSEPRFLELLRKLKLPPSQTRVRGQ